MNHTMPCVTEGMYAFAHVLSISIFVDMLAYIETRNSCVHAHLRVSGRVHISRYLTCMCPCMLVRERACETLDHPGPFACMHVFFLMYVRTHVCVCMHAHKHIRICDDAKQMQPGIGTCNKRMYA